jgi:hypothetical protein
MEGSTINHVKQSTAEFSKYMKIKNIILLFMIVNDHDGIGTSASGPSARAATPCVHACIYGEVNAYLPLASGKKMPLATTNQALLERIFCPTPTDGLLTYVRAGSNGSSGSPRT